MEEKNKTEDTQKQKENSIKKELSESTKAKKKDILVEREYIIPLRKKCRVVPRYKKSNKAIKTIKEFLVRHMKIRDKDLNKIKLDKSLNEAIWARGIKNPPLKIKVRAVKEGEIVRVELSDIPKKIKFKKERLEKREKKAKDSLEKKKPTKKLEEKKEEKTEEEKKEEKEKALAGEEATKQMEKAAAKQTKHQKGGKTKQPNFGINQRRRSGYMDLPLWSAIASVATLVIALPLTLTFGLIDLYTLSIVSAITIVSGLWLFLDKNRNEV